MKRLWPWLYAVWLPVNPKHHCGRLLDAAWVAAWYNPRLRWWQRWWAAAKAVANLMHTVPFGCAVWPPAIQRVLVWPW